MEAKDLMIGDWVLEGGLYPHKVGCLDEQIDGMLPECYSPIPLTPEILEKNGWSHTKLRGSYGRKGMCIDGPPYEVLPDGIKNPLDYAQWSIDEEFQYHLLEIYMWRGNIRLWVNYVHELQHALRLCGIDKTIEL